MSLILFEGAAGTGKTTKLHTHLRTQLSEHPLETEQYVLALTKYHGSRRRMEAKLKGPKGVGNFVHCVTLDSFAWNLVCRWRCLARHLNIEVQQGDFESITSAAGKLLQYQMIRQWVSRRYPFVVIDELQDCKGGEVEMLDGLVSNARCLCAADAFQDLSGDPNNEAISWAKAIGELDCLTRNYRFDQRLGLLNAATAIRNGNALTTDRDGGLEIIGVPKAPMGGGKANWFIKSCSQLDQIAIVTPTRPENSPFVAELVQWISTKAAKTKYSDVTAGPFNVTWEAGDEKLSDDLLRTLNIPDAPEEQICCLEYAEKTDVIGAYDIRDWIERQRSVAGRKTIGTGELRAQIKQIVHRRRAFGRSNEMRRIAMTVHQAKNREFECVIVLWPLKIVQDPEQQRRFLYNAITRAKRKALVLIEDPKRLRLKSSLFAGR